MAFFGLTVGMVFGAICSFVACFVYGLPLWMGLVTYSLFGTMATLATITVMYLRRDDDDMSQMPPMDEDEGDSEWIKALEGKQASDKVA